MSIWENNGNGNGIETYGNGNWEGMGKLRANSCTSLLRGLVLRSRSTCPLPLTRFSARSAPFLLRSRCESESIPLLPRDASMHQLRGSAMPWRGFCLSVRPSVTLHLHVLYRKG